VLFRLSLLQFLKWSIPGSLVPLYTVWLKDLQFDDDAVGLCCATQAVAIICLSPLAGQVADRWMRADRLMALCALLCGLDLFLLAELQTPLAVLLATLFFWTVCCSMLLMGTTICFRHLPRPDLQFGSVRMWGTAGWMVIGLLIGSWLSGLWIHHQQQVPLTDAFRIGGLLSLVLSAYCLTLPPTLPQAKSPTGHWFAPLQVARLLGNRAFLVYCLCLMGVCMTFPLTTQNTPLLLEQLGVERERLPGVLTLAQLSELLLLALLPMLLHHLGLRWTMLLGLSAWLLALTILSIGQPISLVIGSLSLNGLYITGFMIAGQIYANGLTSVDLRGSAQGLVSCLNGIGNLIGNLLASWLRKQGHGDVLLSFAVGAAITALLLLVMVMGFRQPASVPRADPH
jgi:MFS family permease